MFLAGSPFPLVKFGEEKKQLRAPESPCSGLADSVRKGIWGKRSFLPVLHTVAVTAGAIWKIFLLY